MPSKPQELIFPLRGIDDTWAFGRQPEGSCPDAQNVIPFDILDSRARGGQRWGLSKYYSALHNGATALQRMTSIATATTGQDISDAFTQANGVLATTNWYLMKMATYPNWTADTTHPYVSSNAIVHNNTTASGIDYRVGCLHKSAFIEDKDFELTASVTLVRHGGAGSAAAAGFIVRSAFPSFPISISTEQLSAYISFGTSNVTVHVAGTNFLTAIGSSGDYKDPTYWTGGRTMKLTVSGNTFSLYADDVIMGSAVVNATLVGNMYVGLYIKKGDTANDSVTIDAFTSTSTASQSSRNYRIVAISGGDIFSGTPWGSLQAAVSGTNALATSGRVDAQAAFGKVYFADGVNANYKKWDNSDNTVAAWTPSGGTLPVSGTEGARYIALYRGRIVLSGLVDDPQNWFMSAAGDPLDWNYSPATVTATQAVAGNNTDAGYCPDIITCLAPYSDDLMYIGGDHTLWIMRGDPADRGRIDNISYQTGIAGPDAFTFDPNGVFYFFGSGAIWRLSAGGTPEPISRNRMDVAFKDIDLTTNTVHLTWDNVRHGLFIFVVPSAEGATTHYYWDQRTDSFWKIAFPNAHGPTTVLAFDGDDPDDNAMILGGWDGYLRRVDNSVKDDDGTAVSSYILYPPISGGALRNIRLNAVTTILDSESDDAILTAFAEDTVQKVVESATSTEAAVNITAVSTSNKTFTVAEDWSGRAAGDRLLVAGSTGNDGSYTLASISGSGPTVLTVHGTISNATVDGTIQYKDRAKFARTISAERTRILSRIAGNAIMIKISNSVDEKAWAIESLVVEVESIGRTRKNQL